MRIKLKKPTWLYIIGFSIFYWLCFVGTLAGSGRTGIITSQDVSMMAINLFVIIFLNKFFIDDVFEKAEEEIVRKSVDRTRLLIESNDWRAYYAVNFDSSNVWQDMHGNYLGDYATEEDYFEELIDCGFMRISICQHLQS